MSFHNTEPDISAKSKQNRMSVFVPREPVNGFSHLAGAVLSAIGLYLLLQKIPAGASIRHTISVIVFGVSLILLYSASATYHLLNISEKGIMVLRRIDHMMIYVLIAGTYTPICLITLSGAWRWGLFIAIWSLALTGIFLKLVWFNAPRWLSTLFYILMGWLVIIAFVPLLKALSLAGVLWLIFGGVLYTLGGILYATKWPRITSRFIGFHEIFHMFILAGSFCHFWVIFKYIVVY